MHRGAPISEALYNLNKLKIQKQKDNKKVNEELNLEFLEQEAQRAKNNMSLKYLCQKFEREFRTVVLNMATEEKGW